MNIEDAHLRHELDVEILMHRDVHFGGNFTLMLDYYKTNKKGIQPEFEIKQIENLAKAEQRTQKNLAPFLLSGPDAEKIARAKEAYKRLRDLYDDETQQHSYPLLIADLILSEEEYPEKEIEAIIREKEKIVPSLLELLHAQDFYDPLFPGYGQAPSLAANCLGLIGDKRAIISLFEAIGEEDFFNEDVLLKSLKAIGDPAKDFLLKVLKGRPITFDNERAAIALVNFKDDESVSKECLQLLEDPEFRQHLPLTTFLILACEGLKVPNLRDKFIHLADDPNLSNSQKKDIQTVAKSWEP